jgi:hypothetical protein
MNVLGGWQTPNGPHFVARFKNLDEQLHLLREFIAKFRTHPQIRDLAVKIIRDAGAPPKDQRAQALAIGSWVQDNIYYVLELPERFATPLETLRKGAGDCDDFTTLIGALCESIGIPTLMVAMSVNGAWKHIFPAALIGKQKRLLTLDATMRFPISQEVNPVTLMQEHGKKVLLKIL